jgi:hypothetical protein
LGIVIGPATTLEFWHIMSLLDDENAGNGFLPPGGTFGGGQLHVSLLNNSTGKFEKWQRLTPATNGYDSLANDTISICEFDPGDDEIAPANETMCELGPLWADIGDTFGTDPTCVSDTDNNDAAHKDCGATSNQGPTNLQNGTIGAGVWARSTFGLSAFAGRVARLRWIGMEGGGWSFGITRSALEPEAGGQEYQYFDGDDGWYIDDIKLTDLRQFASTIGPDNTTGLATCSAQGDTNNCTSITPAVAGSVAFGTTRLISLDALAQAAILDGRQSAGACTNGMLQYEWSQLNDAGTAVVDVVSPFSPAGNVTVAPSRDTKYRLAVRCSSDLACSATQDVVVKVYGGDGSDLHPQSNLTSIDPNEIGPRHRWSDRYDSVAVPPAAAGNRRLRRVPLRVRCGDWRGCLLGRHVRRHLLRERCGAGSTAGSRDHDRYWDADAQHVVHVSGWPVLDQRLGDRSAGCSGLHGGPGRLAVQHAEAGWSDLPVGVQR